LSTPIIYLAPFQGITGVTFRSVYTKHFDGVDKLYTPFFTNIHNDSKLPKRKLSDLGSISENGVEVVPQILGKDAKEIIRFAGFCHELGFKELNWNLGGPYPQVANKKRGSGLMPYPELIKEILEEVMGSISLRFSVKCRLGYFKNDEILPLVQVFNSHDISEITVHARIGKQLYAGPTDPEMFETVAKQLNIPLVYNGDIFSLKEFLPLQTRFQPLNRWMIGRGLLADPFLPARIKGLNIEDDEQALIRKFVDDLYSSYRKQMNDSLSVIGILKEYWSYLANSFDDSHKVFKKLKKVNDFEGYEDAVSSVFNNHQWSGSGTDEIEKRD